MIFLFTRSDAICLKAVCMNETNKMRENFDLMPRKVYAERDNKLPVLSSKNLNWSSFLERAMQSKMYWLRARLSNYARYSTVRKRSRKKNVRRLIRFYQNENHRWKNGGRKNADLQNELTAQTSKPWLQRPLVLICFSLQFNYLSRSTSHYIPDASSHEPHKSLAFR